MPVAPSSSASAEPVAERSIQEDTRHELLRLAYQGLTGSTLAAGGVALAFACALGLRNPTLTLGLWLAAMLGIVGLRLRLVRAFADGLALYPVGTLVRLASGESGAVVPGGTPRRPLVELRWAADGATIHERLVPASTGDSGLAIVAIGRP